MKKMFLPSRAHLNNKLFYNHFVFVETEVQTQQPEKPKEPEKKISKTLDPSQLAKAAIKEGQQAGTAGEAKLARIPKLQDTPDNPAKQNARIKAWFDMGPRLRETIKSLNIRKEDGNTLRLLYEQKQGGNVNIGSQDNGRWQSAKETSNFNSDANFKRAAEELFTKLNQYEKTQSTRVDWKALCGGNKILEDITSQYEKKPETVDNHADRVRRITAMNQLAKELTKIGRSSDSYLQAHNAAADSSTRVHDALQTALQKVQGGYIAVDYNRYEANAMQSGNFNTQAKFENAVQFLQKTAAMYGINNFEQYCNNNPLVLAALNGDAKKTTENQPAISQEIPNLELDANGRMTIGDAVTPGKQPGAMEAAVADAAEEKITTLKTGETTPTTPATPTAAATTTEKKEVAETRDARKMKFMEKFMRSKGKTIDDLGKAIDADPKKPDEFVKKVEEIQGELWRLLNPNQRDNDKFSKYNNQKKPFWDGAWGGDTQAALELIATNDTIKGAEKMKNIYEALGGKAEAPAPAAEPAKPAEAENKPAQQPDTEIPPHYDVELSNAQNGDIFVLKEAATTSDGRPIPAGEALQYHGTHNENDTQATLIELTTTKGERAVVQPDKLAKANAENAENFLTTQKQYRDNEEKRNTESDKGAKIAEKNVAKITPKDAPAPAAAPTPSPKEVAKIIESGTIRQAAAEDVNKPMDVRNIKQTTVPVGPNTSKGLLIYKLNDTSYLSLTKQVITFNKKIPEGAFVNLTAEAKEIARQQFTKLWQELKKK